MGKNFQFNAVELRVAELISAGAVREGARKASDTSAKRVVEFFANSLSVMQRFNYFSTQILQVNSIRRVSGW